MVAITRETIYRRAAWLICALALLTLALACDNPEPPPSPMVLAVAPTATQTPTPEPTVAPAPTFTPTATPEPATSPTPRPTPDPVGRSQELPAPAGSTVVTGGGLALTIVSANLDAADIVLNEFVHNDPPDAGNRFAMARVRVQNVGGRVDIESYISDSHFDLVGFSTGELSWYKPTCGAIPDELSISSFLGGIGEGNVCFEIPESETGLMLTHQPPCPRWASCVPNRRWLEFANPDFVEAPRVVEVSMAPSPGQEPGHFRTNPAPLGTTVEAKNGVAVTVVSVNPDAAYALMNKYPSNKPPAEGNRFVMARVRVQNVGGDVNSAIDDFQFDLVGDSAVVFWEHEDSCGAIPNPFYAASLFLGEVYEGNVCFETPESETGLTLIYDPRIYHPGTLQHIAEERRWLALGNPPTSWKRPVEPSPDQALGH